MNRWIVEEDNSDKRTGARERRDSERDTKSRSSVTYRPLRTINFVTNLPIALLSITVAPCLSVIFPQVGFDCNRSYLGVAPHLA